MTEAEILRKSDEIVAIAEVKKFLDTPLKHFSCGMRSRSAFVVAGHLEPEILVVDDLRAVGDDAFQRRFLGKMTDVARDGRSVVFRAIKWVRSQVCAVVACLWTRVQSCSGPAPVQAVALSRRISPRGAAGL